MQQRAKAELDQLGVKVLVVTLTKPEKAASYLAKYPLPFEVVTDPTLAAYHAFELGRTSWFTMMRPDVVAGYFKAVVRGTVPTIPVDADVLQLGGDFIVDREHRFLYVYHSKTATDRPKPAALVAAIKAG